jgi:hypothetical protein
MKCGEIEMRAFPYSMDGHTHARELADCISSEEPDHENNNIALAVLVAGIAAIEDKGNREICAYFVIRDIMAKCPSVQQEMNRLMKWGQKNFILCTQ